MLQSPSSLLFSLFKAACLTVEAADTHAWVVTHAIPLTQRPWRMNIRAEGT